MVGQHAPEFIKGEWREAYFTVPDAINYHPKTDNEIRDYNLFVKEHIYKSKKEPEKYYAPYCSFDFEKAREKFEKELVSSSIDREARIKVEIAEIEKKFAFDGKAKMYDIMPGGIIANHGVYCNLNSNAVFNILSFGGDIEYDIGIFLRHQLTNIVHLEEVNRFYGYLKGLLNGRGVAINFPKPNNFLPKSNLSHHEFIEGQITETISEDFDNIGQAWDTKIRITKGDETREYDPIKYLTIIWENYCTAADKETINEGKLTAILNAESKIKRYIWDNKWEQRGYDFRKILDDIDVAQRRIKSYIDFEKKKSENFLNDEKDKIAAAYIDLEMKKNKMIVNEEIAKLKELEMNQSEQNKKPINYSITRTTVNPLELIYIFEDVSKYHKIMSLLVDNGFCQPNTYIWIDQNKGNKGILVAILKHLHSQGYYKENKKLSNEQIQLIAQNSFGWQISIDTIKRAKPGNFKLSFIPSATISDTPNTQNTLV